MKNYISAASVNEFFNQPAIGLVGVSRNPKKFGYSVFNEMRQKGFKVYPVNPNTDNIGGETCYKSIEELPDDTKSVVILSKKEITDTQVKLATSRGINNIWVQQGSETPEVIAKAKDSSMNIIYGYCILMFTQPSGVHSFHRFFVKLFGKLPK